MDAAFKEAMALYSELSASNPAWKKIYDDFSAFRRDANLWFRFTEAGFDDFMQQPEALTYPSRLAESPALRGLSFAEARSAAFRWPRRASLLLVGVVLHLARAELLHRVGRRRPELPAPQPRRRCPGRRRAGAWPCPCSRSISRRLVDIDRSPPCRASRSPSPGQAMTTPTMTSCMMTKGIAPQVDLSVSTWRSAAR